MKYSYFSGGKAGKLLIRNLFWLNGKTHVFYTTGEPPYFAAFTTPEGVCDWYWDGGSYHHVESNNMMNKIYYNEMWHPVTGTIKKWFKHLGPQVGLGRPDCDDLAFQQDMITNPLVMLGYGGVLGSKKLLQQIQARTPQLPMGSNVIEELRKRKNIIAYKEDIRHMAHNFFVGSGRPLYKHPDVLVTQTDEGYIKECTKRINYNRAFPPAIADLLDYYKIPYEMFNLDTGDYAEAFDLEHVFPRDIDPTPELDEYVTDKDIVEGWIDDYVHLFQ